MAFVCKQTAVLVVRINNIGQKQCCLNRTFFSFFTLLCRPDGLNLYSYFSFYNLTHLTTILPFGSLLKENIVQSVSTML